MADDINTLKQNLIQVYNEYSKYSSPAEFKIRCPISISGIMMDNIGLILDLKRKGIMLSEDIKNAVLLETRIATTASEKLTSEEMWEYCAIMARISKGKPLEQAVPAKTTEEKKIQKKPRGKNRPTRPIVDNILSQETAKRRALLKIRCKPGLNPYHNEYREYFRKRIEEQEQLMRTPLKPGEKHTREIPEQKDAYYAFQITTLAGLMSGTQQWWGLENECKRVEEEMNSETGYDLTRLIRYFGPELYFLGMIKKENLPEDIAKIVNALLKKHS